jgi:hypothetical protein
MKKLLTVTALSLITVTAYAKMDGASAQGAGSLFNYHQQCEDFSQSGAEMFFAVLDDAGETGATIAKRFQFKRGMRLVQEEGCKAIKVKMKTTRVYELFFVSE